MHFAYGLGHLLRGRNPGENTVDAAVKNYRWCVADRPVSEKSSMHAYTAEGIQEFQIAIAYHTLKMQCVPTALSKISDHLSVHPRV